MKCGQCHDRHDTVAEVRACYAGAVDGKTAKIPVPQSAFDALRVNRFAGPCFRCQEHVEAEQGHIEKIADKGWKVFHNGECPQIVHGLSGSEARARSDGKPWPDVPAGHYAVKSLSGNNDLDFFRVDRPTQGTWAGRTFVKRVIGGRADTPVRGVGAEKVLKAILAAGPDKAMALFGQTLGYCGRCGRHLTDEESRTLGIGPVCRAALWASGSLR